MLQYGRKNLIIVSFRYLSSVKSITLSDIDFANENQDNIVRACKKLSDLMRVKILNYQKRK